MTADESDRLPQVMVGGAMNGNWIRPHYRWNSLGRNDCRREKRSAAVSRSERITAAVRSLSQEAIDEPPQEQQRHHHDSGVDGDGRSPRPGQHHADLVAERIVVDEVRPGR